MNRLNETVLLSTQNVSLNRWVTTYLRFFAEFFWLSKPVIHVSKMGVRQAHPLTIKYMSHFYLHVHYTVIK